MMNKLCATICCLGVLVALGLSIWVLVKQHDCCGKQHYGLVGATPPSCDSCSGKKFKSESNCNQCFSAWNNQFPSEADGTFYCEDGGGPDAGIGPTGCHNKYEEMGASACQMGQPVATNKNQCGAPTQCAGYGYAPCL
jgi:hypothetical protein